MAELSEIEKRVTTARARFVGIVVKGYIVDRDEWFKDSYLYCCEQYPEITSVIEARVQQMQISTWLTPEQPQSTH